MGLIVPLLLLGLLASLSPTTIVVFILLLATIRAKVNATAFLVGWAISLTIVFLFSYLFGGAGTLQHRGGRAGVEVVEIMLGLALVVIGVRSWRNRHKPRQTSGTTRRLTSHLEKMSPWEASVVGVLEQPWTLTAAAAIVVVHHHSSAPIAIGAFVGFTALSTATIGVIFLYYARQPYKAQAQLLELRDWVARSGPTLVAVTSALVGLYLAVDGLHGLVSN